jgi:hypothetical protein
LFQHQGVHGHGVGAEVKRGVVPAVLRVERGAAKVLSEQSVADGETPFVSEDGVGADFRGGGQGGVNKGVVLNEVNGSRQASSSWGASSCRFSS